MEFLEKLTWFDYVLIVGVIVTWSTIPLAHWQVARIRKKHDRRNQERRDRALKMLDTIQRRHYR